jgi:phytanoyl-CoA hydroxylase
MVLNARGKKKVRSYFGHKGPVTDPLSFFKEENYIICRGATDLSKVDRTYDIFNDLIVGSNDYYLRQSSNWERNTYTDAGGISNCLLQPHQFKRGRNGDFSDSILRLLSDNNIQEALEDISALGPYSLVQTMFFDHSTTGPHQDWIYLDSRPNGKMIAAWVALEEIPEEGIRFYVYPGTHGYVPSGTYTQSGSKWDLIEYHSNFIAEIEALLQSGKYQMYAPPLKKGDIFFWSSKIIHGSTEGKVKSLRRRSIAAHFIPEGYAYGNLETDFDISYDQKYGLRYSTDPMDETFMLQNSNSVAPLSGTE